MRSLSRRTLLKALGGGAVAVTGSYVALGEYHYLPGWLWPRGGSRTPITLSALRPDDFLSLQFEFINFSIQTDSQNQTQSLAPSGSPAYIVVTFPPQSVAEQAFYEVPGTGYAQQDGNGNPLTTGEPGYEANPSTGETPTARPVESLLSGTSRLAFILPSGVNSIPLTLESVLAAISMCDMNVVPAALPPPVSYGIIGGSSTTTTGTPVISTPDLEQTSIEAPFRLIISPNQYERWAHSTDPVTNNGNTEVWHTRLAAGIITNGALDESYLTYIRAVWSPDYASLSEAPPHYDPSSTYVLPGQTPLNEFRSSLDARDRFELVHLTSDFTISNFLPTPATVNHLILSSVGAWIDAAGTWNPPSPLEVEAWNHVATMGRDHYVRVVYKGFLFPFGHSASLVKVTERTFDPAPEPNIGNSQTAYLRQRMYVVVREPVVEYPTAGMQHSGRRFPYTSLTITTKVTPDLDDPTQSEASPGQGQDAFWPEVVGQDFRFACVGKDSDGQLTEFTIPLIFVGASIAVPQDSAHQGILSGIISGYPGAGPGRVQPQMLGQRIALAPSKTAGDTSFETQLVDMTAEGVDSSAPTPPSSQPQFYPAFSDVKVRIPAIAQLTPNSTTKGQSLTTISFPDVYLENGFSSSNTGEVFAQISASNQVPIDFSQDADKVGGMITPSLNIGGLSRIIGLVGTMPNLSDAALATYLGSVAAGQFNPSAFFEQAKILGGISLSSILNSGALAQAPAISSHVIYTDSNPQMAPQAFETTLTWDGSSLLTADPTGTFVPSGGSLKLNAVTHTDLSANPTTTFTVTATLTNFAIHLIPAVLEFLVISFNSLQYTAQSGQKVQVTASVQSVEFAGPLTFINTLEQYIPLDGFNDPPTIDVTPQGVAVGYTLAIPTIAVGVFSLANVSLGAQVTLPFTDDPARVRFSFASREHPFTLSVSLFAGGGFFATSLGLDGVELLEGSFEFGGNFSLDIGVASGDIYANAGIYFQIQTVSGGEQAQLTGFFQCGGSLSVLGLVNLSEQFYLGFTYDTSNNDVYGQATITVEVSIAMFSESVSLSVEKTFGHSTPPTFSDLIGPQDWLDYTQAFAFGV